MKRFVAVVIFAIWLLALSPAVRAQDCGSWNNWDLRGTYTMTGSGWIDLSKVAPGLPAGYVPMSWVGLERMDGRGGGTGWVSANMGGVQTNFEFVNKTYAVQSDCTVQVTYSMKAKEMGGVILGPFSRLLMIQLTGGPSGSLELHGIGVGGGPGTIVDHMVARRVSLNN